MSTDPDHIRALGQLEGKLDQVLALQQQTLDKTDQLDGRLREQESRSAKVGAVGGGVVAVGIALLTESLKSFLNRGGPNP